jgi:6-pyruvoyltetrahydropterin/6-carboxytetrahydropterin synthase
MHGHTWKIVVELKGEVDPKTGFVMDFRELSEEVKPILEVLDHHTLNDVLENPTSENLAYYLFGHLRARLPKLNAIEVYESERSRCRVEA